MTVAKAMTPDAASFALQTELERLIAEAGDDAPWVLKIVETNEPHLSLHGTPKQIAAILVENSSWIRERVRTPARPEVETGDNEKQSAGICPGDHDTLESFLSALYYDGWGE